MRLIHACVVLLFAAGNSAPALAQAARDLNGTRSTLEQWVETRQLISRTKADWQSDRETLEQTVSLFERELASLDAQLSGVSTNSAQVEREREAALAEQTGLTAAADALKLVAAALEQKVAALASRFPQPLKEKIQPLLDRVPTDPSATKMSGAQRLQNVVGILNELDKFNGAVTVISEIQKSPSGAEVQVETIYLGLAQAYFVDKSGEYAGIGLPEASGWKWTEQRELAPRIQSSIEMYKNARPAAFVSLPVQIR